MLVRVNLNWYSHCKLHAQGTIKILITSFKLKPFENSWKVTLLQILSLRYLIKEKLNFFKQRWWGRCQKMPVMVVPILWRWGGGGGFHFFPSLTVSVYVPVLLSEIPAVHCTFWMWLSKTQLHHRWKEGESPFYGSFRSLWLSVCQLECVFVCLLPTHLTVCKNVPPSVNAWTNIPLSERHDAFLCLCLCCHSFACLSEQTFVCLSVWTFLCRKIPGQHF